MTNTPDTEDTIGHGTSVTSIILGSEPAGVTGVASNARVVSLVVTCLSKDGIRPSVSNPRLWHR